MLCFTMQYRCLNFKAIFVSSSCTVSCLVYGLGAGYFCTCSASVSTELQSRLYLLSLFVQVLCVRIGTDSNVAVIPMQSGCLYMKLRGKI